MNIELNRICDVVAASPQAEELLEEAGIDYWFGWERMLKPACEAVNVDPRDLASRLESSPPCSVIDSRPETLAALLRELDEGWEGRLSPAIATALASAATLPESRGERAARLLSELQWQFKQHTATSRSLLPVADAIEKAQAGIVGRGTIRTLRLEHLDFARIAADLREEADKLAADPRAAESVAIFRKVIREIHQHIKIAYNFILPRLVTAAAARPVECEPW